MLLVVVAFLAVLFQKLAFASMKSDDYINGQFRKCNQLARWNSAQSYAFLAVLLQKLPFDSMWTVIIITGSLKIAINLMVNRALQMKKKFDVSVYFKDCLYIIN